MALRSSGVKLSFEILPSQSSCSSDDFLLYERRAADPRRDDVVMPRRKRQRRKKNRNKKSPALSPSAFPEDQTGSDSVSEENGNGYCCGGGAAVECQTVISSSNEYWGELRQRNDNVGGGEGEEKASCSRVEEKAAVEENGVEVGSTVEHPPPKPWRSESANGSAVVEATKLETAESLDWKRLMAEDPNYIFSVEKSPVRYFVNEVYRGNSLRSTTTPGSEKERGRVYDTIFRLPWRCELLIAVGFFVCLDSFLSLLTIMPMRTVMTLWRLLNTRQFKKLSAAELCDFGCLIVLASGVAILQRTDISLIYHMIRGQGTIKLYVVYNVLEIFDKLCQSFGRDALETLFNSAEGLANCSTENLRFWILRFLCDQALAMAASNSFILLAQAITLSTCIVAHNNALLALLVSNNFSEIKSNVFKRFSRDNIQSLVLADSVERFHILAFLLFVLAQNILEAESPWFESFLFIALLVFFCEMLIDIIKHSFLAKFNNIKPIAYSEFVEDLCNQTLGMQIEDKKKILTFVPLAPACVVIRALSPVYAAHLPSNPLLWRFFWIILLSAVTYVMLTSLKVTIGMGLRKYASWYVNRCRRREKNLHYD